VAAPCGAGAEDSQESSLLIRSRWTYFEGWIHQSGRLEFRQMGPRLGSLRWTWPDLPLLPESQVLLLDGETLLGWSRPEGINPIDPEGRRLEPLRRLGAGFLAALLSGERLQDHFTAPVQREQGGWRRIEGELGGSPAVLTLVGPRARLLLWNLPEGRLQAQWDRELSGRRVRLEIRFQDGGMLEIRSRAPEPRLWRPEDLFFREGESGR